MTTRDDQIAQLRSALEHAPQTVTVAEGLLGWNAPEGFFICAQCAGRIMARGCAIMRHSQAVWSDTTTPPVPCALHDAPATSWAPEFLVQGKWCGNAQRFATEAEARESAQARFAVWTMPSDYRAVPSSDPVTYAIVNGRDTPIDRPT